MRCRLSKPGVSGLAMVTFFKLRTAWCSVLHRLVQQNVNALSYHWRKRLCSFILCTEVSTRLLGFCETRNCQPKDTGCDQIPAQLGNFCLFLAEGAKNMKKGMNAICKEKSRKGEACAGSRGPRKQRPSSLPPWAHWPGPLILLKSFT